MGLPARNVLRFVTGAGCGTSALLIVILCPSARAQSLADQATARERLHATPQWAMIAAHLPDRRTATPEALEMQADILRARRYPEDAMDFYVSAIDRGGRQPELLNKLGLTELEMRNESSARVYFERAIRADRKSSDAWNNLGAIEYMEGRQSSAITDYRRAIKLSRNSAVFHANLGTALFERKDYGGARKEIATALRIDPQIFDRTASGSGVAAHVLSSADRARFYFEMAKFYARSGDGELMMHALAKASEAGLDIQHEMHRDAALAGFENDPQVVVIVHNSQALRIVRTTAQSVPGVLPAAAAEAQAPEAGKIVN